MPALSLSKCDLCGLNLSTAILPYVPLCALCGLKMSTANPKRSAFLASVAKTSKAPSIHLYQTLPQHPNFLPHIILLMHQHILITLQLHITLIVTKIIRRALLCRINIRKIMKVKPFLSQTNSIHRFLS